METKSFLKSLGVMGPILSGAALMINQWLGGGSILVEASEPQALVDAATSIIDSVFVVVGLVTGIIGRWKASTKVTLSGTP